MCPELRLRKGLRAMTWKITFPFFPIMNLIANCLNYSEDSEGVADLRLLIELSMNFLSHYADLARSPQPVHSRTSTLM